MSSVASSNEDVEVRKSDQESINEFGRLNNLLLELRADIKQYKLDIEKLDDASAEAMLATGGKIMLFLGEAFVETTEDYATDYCSRRQEELQQEMENLTKEEEQILARQNILKKELYGRFGDSINLEN